MKPKLLHLAAIVVVILAATSTAQAQTHHATPIQHARHVIAFFENHPKAAATRAGRVAIFKAAHILDSAVRSLQAVRAAKLAAASQFPPHHALWECIQDYEGAWDSRAGLTDIYLHYGGLQMTWNWMKLIPGNAGNLSQADQEWAAEKAWAQNGYSYSFLYGQWYQWDNADGCGTTG